ncbi:hypothetical protein ABT093_28000 [Kitasatospora sp. NPDC002551]|uniref:hypothetical protein n=1 Tax=Kitasatospora sp. NPDC002551 TaxID=3154539 RepID=UPI00332CF1DA
MVVDDGVRKGRSGPVPWFGVLREAASGVPVVAGLPALLFVTVGVGPKVGVIAFAMVGVFLAFVTFVAMGRRGVCAAKKAVVMVFGWMEYAV